MLGLAILAILAIAAEAATDARAEAHAAVRVLAPATASREEWERAPPERRRRFQVIDESGRRIEVLALEFE